MPSGPSGMWTFSSALAIAISSASVLMGLLMMPDFPWATDRRRLPRRQASVEGMGVEMGAALALRFDPPQSDDLRQRAGGDRFAFGGFRRQRRTRDRVLKSCPHFAQEAVERIDACRHFCDRAEFGAAGRGGLARGLEGDAIDIAAHQWRIFFAEPGQSNGVLGKRVADHGADHVALLRRIERFEVAPAIGIVQFDLF